MAHFLVLVAADDLGEALAPFEISDGGRPLFTRECLCTRGPDDAYTHPPNATCILCRGRGRYETDVNPIGSWDSYIATTGTLRWLPGRRPMRARDDYAGLFSRQWRDDIAERLTEWSGDWDQARKRDLDIEAMLASGWSPYAVVANGRWHQSDDAGWFPSIHRVSDRSSFSSDWPAELRALLAGLADDVVLTQVDCHG